MPLAFASVTQILVIFVKTFNKSREENVRLADAEKKKLEKEAMKERATPKKTEEMGNGFPFLSQTFMPRK